MALLLWSFFRLLELCLCTSIGILIAWYFHSKFIAWNIIHLRSPKKKRRHRRLKKKEKVVLSFKETLLVMNGSMDRKGIEVSFSPHLHFQVHDNVDDILPTVTTTFEYSFDQVSHLYLTPPDDLPDDRGVLNVKMEMKSNFVNEECIFAKRVFQFK